MSAPTRPDWGPATCGCGCRPSSAHTDGCGCRECQPGPGLSYGHRRGINIGLRATGRQAFTNTRRMEELLRVQTLTPEETAELDDLFRWYLGR